MEKLIGKGAEAYIYKKDEMILKVRREKKYRDPILDLKLRKSRTKKESTALKRCNSAEVPTPKLLLVDADGTRIIMEYVNGKRLSEVELTNSLLEQAGKILGKIHTLDLCHGDFSPNNIIVDESGVMRVIDFGLCEFTTYYEKKASDLMVMHSALKDNNLFSAFIEGYTSTYPDAEQVIKRFTMNMQRGRYKVRN